MTICLSPGSPSIKTHDLVLNLSIPMTDSLWSLKIVLLFQMNVLSLTTMIFFLRSILMTNPWVFDVPSSDANVQVEDERIEKAIRMIPPILIKFFTLVPPSRKGFSNILSQTPSNPLS